MLPSMSETAYSDTSDPASICRPISATVLAPAPETADNLASAEAAHGAPQE